MMLMFSFILVGFLLAVLLFCFAFYIRENAKYLSFLQDRVKSILNEVEEMEEHLNIVGNMEKFINEPVLTNLQKHMLASANTLREMRTSFVFDQEQEQGDTQNESQERKEEEKDTVQARIVRL